VRLFVKDVEYNVHIFGEGEPVLFLHGFTSRGSSWETSVRPLAEKYKVILIDLLGHGDSSKPQDPERFRIENAADDLADVLQQLNISRVSVVGYSMGGRLAITFVARHTAFVEKLVLESSSPGLRTELERQGRIAQDEKLANMILTKGVPAFVDYWTNIPLFESQKRLDEVTQNKVYEERLSNNALGLANSLKGMGTGAQGSWWEYLPEIQCPVLLLTGSLDEKFCRIAGEMEAGLKNVSQVTFLDKGHALHVEDPEKFGTIVLEFLSNSTLE
jgi:2-succinyl-6-hydroxy-2,4-cyclohexadiene-1-carboxylate synthase